MPYQFVCPHCSARLESDRPVPAGRTRSCPECEAEFTLSKPAKQVSDREQPKGKSTGRAADGQRSGREDDRDDDTPQPRSKRSRDDERPRRSSGRADDSDDDDRPSARRGRSKRRDDGPDDRRRPRKRKRRRKGLLLALVAVAVLVLGAGGGALYLLNPFGSGGGPAEELLVWMPADSFAVEYVDVQAVAKEGSALQGLRTEYGFLERFGMPLSDVQALAAGGPFRLNDRDTYVVKLKAPADRARIAKAAGGQESHLSGKTYLRTADLTCIHFATDQVVVVTSDPARMGRVLEKKSGNVLSADLKAAVRKADGQVWAASANTGRIGSGADLKGDQRFNMSAMPDTVYRVTSLKVAGDRVDSKTELKFIDSYHAAKAMEIIQHSIQSESQLARIGVGKTRDYGEMIAGAKASIDGSTITVTMTGTMAAVQGKGRGLPF